MMGNEFGWVYGTVRRHESLRMGLRERRTQDITRTDNWTQETCGALLISPRREPRTFLFRIFLVSGAATFLPFACGLTALTF